MAKSQKKSAASSSKKSITTKKDVKPVEETVEEVEKEDLKVSSSAESESDIEGSDIEGLSSADEGDGSSSSHKIKKLKPKQQNKSNNGKANDAYSGIIYVSRLPHGFHERELSKYFSQFGDLKVVRLARNKKTGKSRHYGFVEFVNKDDAKVAHESMDNYLLLGHLLKVKLLPKGAKIEKLFKYKKRVFSETPVKKSREELKKSAKAKHDERLAKLSESGINFKW
ncbi:hypothetical protein Kpol_1029p3 [Vanderwaltozyma polyspora DSM 70294]|uniref:RRM domain-containing protein n=1 Tax=Vanderwaltozyma polyspora (strain ATCC 22028 / DSM 70294 / BCRC 21397 / CBS 2163 / NBRC 10782 / NRRL Y-8283 / UCD 57-17) TaxID=436907 RepID=A7TR62_VANPO|nr:uncharacterized protein Kpol_1029p3 [Vanderwaltozyma polyspora DSM 70294]EDO15230.1 hypothetical protein Kpol_1029p3 [Vanderwaltozyma polyspora DSM 70294]